MATCVCKGLDTFVATLVKDTLALDALADSTTCSKSGRSRAVQGKTEGKGSGLYTQGDS